ncbi:hypothetical protein KSP39_PZI001732 [Platanthera zijinensis]|uniref:Uncharacterized protein n=1 Tax=Platanthera zijinensis TaxID=2320716 RepID=A0AAP0BY45_9ASPA
MAVPIPVPRRNTVSPEPINASSLLHLHLRRNSSSLSTASTPVKFLARPSISTARCSSSSPHSSSSWNHQQEPPSIPARDPIPSTFESKLPPLSEVQQPTTVTPKLPSINPNPPIFINSCCGTTLIRSLLSLPWSHLFPFRLGHRLTPPPDPYFVILGVTDAELYILDTFEDEEYKRNTVEVFLNVSI